MPSVRLTAKTEAAKARLKKIAAGLNLDAIDKVVDVAAHQTQASLIRKTPKKWFGQVRRGWFVSKIGPGQRVVANSNKIMLFLEEGTKAHGPLQIQGPRRPGERLGRAALFIPLTRKAVNATAGIYGVGTVDQFTTQGETYWETRRALFQRTETVRRGRRTVGSRAFVFGIDYVLAKRVKGIKAMHIVANERPIARKRLLAGMKRLVRSLTK